MASALLSLLICGVFTFLIGAIIGMRDAAVLAKHSEEVMNSVNDLKGLVIDLQTGQRGYRITRDEKFLEPWTAARANFSAKADELRRLAAAHEPGQGNRAKEIAQDSESYISDYSDPVVKAVRANLDTDMNGKLSPGEGKRRIDRLRGQFDEFIRIERSLSREHYARSSQATHRAVVVAVGGIGASILLIVAFGTYLTHGVVRPVRRTSRMAGAVARGDLSVRMPETSKAEIGHLERSFNSMADSLQRNRDELAASRARVVVAGDAARRRIERDLHDGIQQRLVTLGLELRMAEDDTPPEQESLKSRLSWTVQELTDVLRELREISRGIHPAILSKGGLNPAVATLARRSPVPVDYHLKVHRRLGERAEVAVYYVVSEALTNAAKHANASCVHVELSADGEDVRLLIRDDGVGGADLNRGSGLIGLRDRVEALGGEIKIMSPVNAGTTLFVRIPAGSP
jgi:signal transduction histidine kinase